MGSITKFEAEQRARAEQAANARLAAQHAPAAPESPNPGQARADADRRILDAVKAKRVAIAAGKGMTLEAVDDAAVAWVRQDGEQIAVDIISTTEARQRLKAVGATRIRKLAARVLVVQPSST